MRILITNDDGIYAEGLKPLVAWARTVGEVTVAAPKVEQSGKSHGIELRQAFEVKKVDVFPGITAYSVDSTPADCIRFAVLGLKERYDLILSGINKGLNIGCDIMYSGTVGAIFEAAALDIPAIAVSTQPASFASAAENLPVVWAFMQEHKLLERHSLYNVNIPLEVKGIRITRQGGPYFSDDFEPVGNDMYLPKGKCVYEESNDFQIDTNAVLHGYISIMPVTIDRTDLQVLQDLAHLNQ